MAGYRFQWSLITAFMVLSLGSLCRAQVNVSTYGAKGDGKTDDTAALQNAIDSVAPGSTLVFGASQNTYLISSELVFRPNLTYQGQGTILMSAQAAPHTPIVKIAASSANSISISGITFDANGVGGAIQIAVGGNNAVPATNFTLRNAVIRNTTQSPAGPWDGAVYAPVGLVNSTISGNQISNCAYGMSLYNLNNVSIAQNLLQSISMGDAIGVTFAPAPFSYGQGIRITGNHGQNLGRMAIELWPSGGNDGQSSQVSGIYIDGNSFSQWNTAPGVNGFGISVMAGSSNVIVNNKLIGSLSGYGIELGSPNSFVNNNTVQNFATGIMLHDTAGAQVNGNTLVSQEYDGIELSNAQGSRHNITIENNSIINAQTIGIFSNATDWGGSAITGNMISRSAGNFPGDDSQSFTGLAVTPPDSPVTVASNVITQTASANVNGFTFTGIRINGNAGSNLGSNYQANMVGSVASGIETIGLLGNADGTLNGATVQGNTFTNLNSASGGAPSPEAIVAGNTMQNCLQPGPLF